MVKKKGYVLFFSPPKRSPICYINKISIQLKTIRLKTLNFFRWKKLFWYFNFVNQYFIHDRLLTLPNTHLIFHMTTHQIISLSFLIPKSKFIMMHHLIQHEVNLYFNRILHFSLFFLKKFLNHDIFIHWLILIPNIIFLIQKISRIK